MGSEMCIRDRLMSARRALRQLPFVVEQVVKEMVAPLRRRLRPGDFGAAGSPSACEDVTQSETADVAGPPQAAAVEEHCHRERFARHLKVGVAGTAKFEARIKELVENLPDLAALVEPLLVVRRVLREQIAVLHRRLLAVVRNDEVCRRLMTTPGVGPVVALTYRATICLLYTSPSPRDS